MKKYILFFFLLASAWADPKIKVVATFSILSDLVRQVGGDRVEVASLVGEDQDPHMYEPKPSDIKKITDADLVFINGLGFEGWLKRLIESSDYKGELIVVSDAVHPRLVFEGTLIRDPHAWHSIPNAKIYVTNILEALKKLDPASQDYYEKRARTYLSSLTKLDQSIREEIDQIPPQRRKIITAHDAFGYFGNTYGVEFLAPKGISTETEAKVQNVVDLIKKIRKYKIKTVFIENIADPKLLKQIAQEGGATLGGTLYSDALSSKDGPAPTYLEMMRYNVDLLLSSMQQYP